MKREQLTEKILDAKRSKGLTWKSICKDIGGSSPVIVTMTPLVPLAETNSGGP